MSADVLALLVRSAAVSRVGLSVGSWVVVGAPTFTGSGTKPVSTTVRTGPGRPRRPPPRGPRRRPEQRTRSRGQRLRCVRRLLGCTQDGRTGCRLVRWGRAGVLAPAPSAAGRPTGMWGPRWSRTPDSPTRSSSVRVPEAGVPDVRRCGWCRESGRERRLRVPGRGAGVGGGGSGAGLGGSGVGAGRSGSGETVVGRSGFGCDGPWPCPSVPVPVPGGSTVVDPVPWIRCLWCSCRSFRCLCCRSRYWSCPSCRCLCCPSRYWSCPWYRCRRSLCRSCRRSCCPSSRPRTLSPGRRAWRPRAARPRPCRPRVGCPGRGPRCRVRSVAGGRRRGRVRVARQRRRQRGDGLEHPLLVEEPGVAFLLAHARQ